MKTNAHYYQRLIEMQSAIAKDLAHRAPTVKVGFFDEWKGDKLLLFAIASDGNGKLCEPIGIPMDDAEPRAIEACVEYLARLANE